MFKKLSYNRLKWIELVAFGVLFTHNLLWLLISESFNLVSLLINTLFILVAVTVLFTGYSVYFIEKRKDRKRQEDELSKMNQGKADGGTLVLVMFALTILMIVSFFLDITLSSELVLCVSSALFATRAGLYLYYERTGISNAGIDDED